HNARTNGTGTSNHYAVYRSSASGWSSDHNLLHVPAGTPNSFIGYSSGARQTLADWQSSSGQDANSVIGDPGFVAPSAGIAADLHIDDGQPTPIEGMGVDMGVTHDFDNEERSTLTPVDRGAQAGDFLAIEAFPPTIVYTDLGTGICNDGARTLVAAITVNPAQNPSGVVDTGTGAPTLYWRYQPVSGSYTDWDTIAGPSLGSDQYAFLVGAGGPGGARGGYLVGEQDTDDNAAGNRLGRDQYAFRCGAGVPDGATVEYFVGAQDNDGNVAVYPATGADGLMLDPPGALTPPTAPSQYTLLYTLAGTYPVGDGQALNDGFNTLSAAIAAYNVGCVVGAVVF